MALPQIMVAPNGARWTKNDHAQLPVSIEEVVTTAISCRDAGADGLHAHVRNDQGRHVLDVGLYQELIRECDIRLPEFYVQITTEAVGKYSCFEQDQLVRALKPKSVSVALGEMAGDIKKGFHDKKLAEHFYNWASDRNIEVQHILYDVLELEFLVRCIEQNIIPPSNLKLLLVLGRYQEKAISSPAQIQPMVQKMISVLGKSSEVDWALCAFGKFETDCLLEGIGLGGKVRVGFENNFLNRDGSIAKNNAQRVSEIVAYANHLES